MLEHNTDTAGMWITDIDTLGEGLVFELPGKRMLESIAIWNYNRPAYTDIGVQKADISIWTADDGWKTLRKGVELQEAEGSDDYDEPTILTFEPVSAEKVRFENLTAFNPKAKQLGLSEISFYEPLGPAACNPDPVKGAQAACLDVIPLTWTAGRNAIVHDIYLGRSIEDLMLLGRVKGAPQVKVSGLTAGEEYIWRVDEVAKDGTVTPGPVWSFTMRGSQIAHWKLDSSTDDEASRFNGTLEGNPTWQTGRSGQAIQLDGEDDSIEVPTLDLNTNTLTLCAWINADTQVSSVPGIVFCRTDQTVAGINLLGDALRYHWNDLSATYDWSSGLTVPQGQWVFVALTVVPQKGTLYLYDGSELKFAENTLLHTTEEFNGPLYIGRDPYENRNFKGLVDEVRIYDFPLSAAQIETIARGQEIALGEQGDIRLVEADLVPEGISLADIAAAAEQPDDTGGGRVKNLIAVALIVLVFIGMACVSVLRKKK